MMRFRRDGPLVMRIEIAHQDIGGRQRLAATRLLKKLRDFGILRQAGLASALGNGKDAK